MPEPTEPTEAQLAELLEAIIAFEPEFRGIPGWRLRELAQRLAESVDADDTPSKEEIAAILTWATARRAAQAEADATDATEPGQ